MPAIISDGSDPFADSSYFQGFGVVPNRITSGAAAAAASAEAAAVSAAAAAESARLASLGGTAPEALGAIGDGQSHPASIVLGVSTLAALQSYQEGLYGFADSIENEMDYLAWQAALYRGGVVRGKPGARYRIDHNLVVPNGRVQPSADYCDLLWESMTAQTDDGTNLVVNGNFTAGSTGWVNTLLTMGSGAPPVQWTFGGGQAQWLDGALGEYEAHFGQMGHQMFLPKGKWTAEAYITVTEGASAGFYGPPYCGLAFANDHVGQGFPEWPDPLYGKKAELPPTAVDGVPTLCSFDFEITEDAGRTMWLTFSCGNANFTVDNVRVKPFLMNYAVWLTGDPIANSTSTYEYDDTTWTGGQFIGPNLEWSDTFSGEPIGGILHKNFQGDGPRCNLDGVNLFKWKTGITLSDHAYLNAFTNTKVGFCDTAVYYTPGAVNAAENFRFTDCVLFNSGLAVHAAGGGEWFFQTTSFDYCKKVLVADRGAYIVTPSVHIEGHHAETYLPLSDVVADFGSDLTNRITGGTSGATALLLDDKTDEGNPRVVVKWVSGTFVSGETITGSLEGEATLGGAIVFGDYVFEVRGGSMWSMPSGEILMAGGNHAGAPYLGLVETNADHIAFGKVWLYNLGSGTDVTWDGGGRVTVEKHLGPTNPNLARLWLVNHQSDAHAGLGDFTTAGGLEDFHSTDMLPEDAVPLDVQLYCDGDRDTRVSYVGGPSMVLDATNPRVTGGSSLRLDIPNTYGSGSSVKVRVLVPVTPGKIVFDRYYISKPTAVPNITHGPYVSGTPAENVISVSTLNGQSRASISHDYVAWIGGAPGPQEGWEVTLSGVTGDPGGIPNATWNATHTILDNPTQGLTIDLGVEATSTVTAAGGAGITATYTQTNFLVWDSRYWVKVIGRTPWDNLPIVVQDQYQGESNYVLALGAADWTLGNPVGNRWWYTEPFIPDNVLDRTGNGRAPEWATHMMMELNLQNLLYALDGTDPPSIHLAGFFANVV